MALRLLRQRVPLKDSQIEGLKTQMLQLGDELWFSRDMITDEKAQLAMRRQATAWLNEQGCFSAERLLDGFRGALRHVSTLEHFAAFLRHLGFTVAAWKRSGFFCFQPPPGLDERLAEGSKAIVELLKEAGGTLALDAIQEAMSHLTADALEGIRVQFLPEVHRTEVGGHPCWRSTDAIPLPEDFAEKLTAAVDTLVTLGEKVSAASIEFALSLSYRIRFREVHGLPDNGAFMRVCAKHYQGANDVFPSATRPRGTPGDVSLTAKRTRSVNTRFRHLGVPIGARLVFTRDAHVTCTVLDDTNQVEYQGTHCAISALAIRLLSVSGANGFSYFTYEGETLWQRRLRLDREANPDAQETRDKPPPTAERRAEGTILGLEGQPLHPATWRAFKSAGTSTRVAEWARRVENGETVEAIARESRYAASTVKVQIGDRRRYFKVCEINHIMPEGGADV
jgi:hypothetical protein